MNIRKNGLCRRGHDVSVMGVTNDGHCKECERLRCRKWRQDHPNEDKEYYESHKEEFKIRSKAYYEAHKDEVDTINRQWREAHQKEIIVWREENAEELREYSRCYRKEHPDKWKEAKIKSETNRSLRVVLWTDWDKINEFELSRPVGMTTDHIIPLQGKLVSGLHVSWNLQYLTQPQNSSKGIKVNLLEASEWYGQILEEAGLK